jgi:pimeloyl-ACP methyl ester carboxylesterase
VIDRRHICFTIETGPGASWPHWHVSAWLTVPAKRRRDELQVLVHGAGLDHRYWDWPLNPERYSYVSWAAERGIATLNIDRIGCGFSSRPPGAEVTIPAQAHVLAGVVATVRSGGSGMPSFARVVLVGHSLGSVVCGVTAAHHRDLDALVLTGYLPVDGTAEMGDELFDFAFAPALDGMPHLRGLVDAEYLVARDEFAVDELRYWSAQADPDVIAFETLSRGPATRAELRDAAVAGATIRTVTAPTLGLVGQHDALLIDASLAEVDTADTVRRVARVTPPNFEFAVTPDTGHMLNLHRNAHAVFTTLDDWLAGCAPA